MEQVRQINCCNIECDNFEELPLHEQRHHSKNFIWIVDSGDHAFYECACGYVTESTIEEVEE